MTDPQVRLEPTRLTVEPGGQVLAVVTVRNVGTIVEGFRLDVLGQVPAAWVQVIPPELSVYPENELTATVVFSPPAGAATPAGTFPFAVRATSVVNASVSAVAEGDLEIARVAGLQGKLVPVTSSGRWGGEHRVELSNSGNFPVRLRMRATDPDERLAFLVSPETVDVPVGGMVVAHVKVRTKGPFLRGNPVRLPFQVLGEAVDLGAAPATPSAGPQQTAVDGALMQQPILSRTVVGVLGLAAALAIAGTAYAVTKDEVKKVDPGIAAATTPPTTVLPVPKTSTPPTPKVVPVPIVTPVVTPKVTRTPEVETEAPKPIVDTAVSGRGTLAGGVTEVKVPNLAPAAKIFLTPDLTRISGAGTRVTDNSYRTGAGYPAAALRVSGRSQTGFVVVPITGSAPEDLRFSYLVVDKPSGTLGTLPYAAGSGTLAAGQKRVEIPDIEEVTPKSVIILTVEGAAEQSVRVDNKADGSFTVATMDITAAASDIKFNWIVVDPVGGGAGKANAAAGFGQTQAANPGENAPRVDNGLISDDAAVLVTTDATSFQDPEFGEQAFADVCVVVQGSGFAQVEPFFRSRPFIKTPFNWLVVA